ncbi:MAG: nitric oxide synthase oxygenase [Gammaproteobacteria bacterium]|nr:MAG: nitric oxide synthase oxygenase [Gammaproteobacteria bacterium]
MERCEEASRFIEQFYRENALPDAEHRARRREVRRDMLRHGHYEHTPAELAYGARVAWRNHARCIGRLSWQSLEVVDCRDHLETDDIAARLAAHLREAAGDGRIRSIISVFAPVKGDGPGAQLPAYIESRQLIQYAGYLQPDMRPLGDALNVETTRTAMAMGWQPPDPRGAFDLLPLLLRDARGRRLLYPLPADCLHEISIEHPREPELAKLGLRWYSVPCISSMVLSIGGVEYPCAPFNGHYMTTEIASRNLTDERRYDLLPQVAESLGIPREGPGSALWRDRTLTELNEAVLHSFRRAGITIVDQHQASDQYLRFVQREEAAGRRPSADWSWIVPPQAGAATAVFHLPMEDRQLLPNFYYSRASDGGALAVNYDDEHRSRLLQRLDRLRRRFYAWQRRRA